MRLPIKQTGFLLGVGLLSLLATGCDSSGKPDITFSTSDSQTAPPRASASEPQPTWPPVIEGEGQASFQAADLLRKNYYIILDGSGSMDERKCSGEKTKHQAAKEAIIDFSKKMPVEDNLGMLIFDAGGISERVSLGTGNGPKIRQQLLSSHPSGSTPLRSAIEIALDSLTRQATRQLGYGEYHLIVVTDGEASPGYDPTSLVNRVLDQTSVQIHTIGFCIDTDHSLNQPGRTMYSAVNDASKLGQELEAVLAESESFDVGSFK